MNTYCIQKLLVGNVGLLFMGLSIVACFGVGVSSASSHTTFAQAHNLAQAATPERTPVPNEPQPIEQVSQLRGGFSSSVVSGTLADMDEAETLAIVDLSVLEQPLRTLLSSTGNSSFTDVQVVNALAYVRDDSNKLFIFDISDPSNPVLAGSYSAANISFTDLRIPGSGNVAYSIANLFTPDCASRALCSASRSIASA